MANIGTELLNVPFPEMVEALGMSIARAQHALDMNSVKMAQIMSGGDWLDEDDEGKEVLREGTKVSFGGKLLSLLELGFTPTFYQFVDTLIEVKVSMSMQSETKESRSTTDVNMQAQVKLGWGSARASMSVSTVSAAFSARNSFSAEGASLIRTKLVPLPPPAVLTERVRALMEESKKRELTLDPVVLEFGIPGTGGTAPSKTVKSDLPLASPVALDGFTITIATNVATISFASSLPKPGVYTINLAATDGTKKGIVKVLVTAAPTGTP